MRNYLFNISEEERSSILDKHKKVYDGYAVNQTTPNQQPLYVQDFANDKEGITINSKGDISTYSNKIYMKESKNVCSECGLYEEVCECGYKQVKGIGDKFDYVEGKDKDEDLALAIGANDNSEDQDIALAVDEDECNECGGMYETDIDEIMDEIEEDLEFKDEADDVKESIQESINWFKRFKKYN